MVSLTRILSVIKDRGGFIIDADMKWLLLHCPDRMVLVRCNLDRFLCKVSEVMARMEMVKANPDNYVRDVSLPTTDPIWANDHGR